MSSFSSFFYNEREKLTKPKGRTQLNIVTRNELTEHFSLKCFALVRF